MALYWRWWAKTSGMDKKESLPVWIKTNIAVHKKQVIECEPRWWLVTRTGLLWCAFLPSIHPSTFSHILYTLDQSLMPEKRISSLASSPSDDQNACHAFLLHLNSNVRVPLERIYCWVATSRSATVPYTLCSARIPQRASKDLCGVSTKKRFIHQNASFGRPWNFIPEVPHHRHHRAQFFWIFFLRGGGLRRCCRWVARLSVVVVFLVGAHFNNNSNPLSVYGYVTVPPMWTCRAASSE